MHTPESKKNFIENIAKAADLCMKPWIHSVVLDNSIEDPLFNIDSGDLIFLVQCRDTEGVRLKKNDLEIEIYRSGKDVNIMLSWISCIDRPILWQGKHSMWINGDSGSKCSPPDYGEPLEALARRLRAMFC